MEAGGGVRIEELATLTTRLEPQLFVLAPGASSQGSYAHAGEEFMFVLAGRVAVWLDERVCHELDEGDALTFPSTLPTASSALDQGETRILWVNTPPTSDGGEPAMVDTRPPPQRPPPRRSPTASVVPAVWSRITNLTVDRGEGSW